MARILITAQVEDSQKWEEGFRSHGDLFDEMTLTAVYFCTTEDNEVAVLGEADDLNTYMEILNSPATAEAMAFDGVKRETVKVYILDKEL